MHDIVIIGAGVIGCSIARLLSSYKLDVVVLEKENDVCLKTSGANSAILHSGYDPLPNTLKAKLNVIGNKMFDALCEQLDVEIIRTGSLTVARNEEEVKVLEVLKNRANENGVEVEIISRDEVIKLVPNITKDVICALYAKTAGIINPFELTIGLMENAMDNGVKLKLNSEVIAIKKEDYFTVITKKEEIKAKIVINCAGLHSDEVNSMINDPYFKIRPRRGEYMVLDHFDKNFLKYVIFTPPTSAGKGVLVTPTTAYNYLIGPSSNFVDDKDDVRITNSGINEVKEKANKIIENINYKHMIKQFSGNRAVSDNEDFIIEEASPNFINVAGIQSPGLVASPAIALEVLKILENRIDLVKNVNFNPIRRKQIRFNRLSDEEKEKLIKENSMYGNIICRCEKVTEAEIRDAIKRNCGATTVKGVKRRVRAGFGRCQGSFCQPRVIKILSEELNIPEVDVLDGGNNSKFLSKVGIDYESL